MLYFCFHFNNVAAVVSWILASTAFVKYLGLSTYIIEWRLIVNAMKSEVEDKKICGKKYCKRCVFNVNNGTKITNTLYAYGLVHDGI